MIHAQPLTSLQNPQVKQAVLLRERRERDKTGLFLIEGYREILRAIDAGQLIEKLFVCSDLFLGTHESTLIERITSSGAKIFSCSAPVFEKLSYRDRPDGLLAVAPQQAITLERLEQQNRDIAHPF